MVRFTGTPLPKPGDVFVRYGRGFIAASPADLLPPRWFIRAPLTKRPLRPRPIAVIERDIRRAAVPGLRQEDV